MEDYLIHYGVKGMRWGVRRYQNEDGSLTSAGRKKASKINNKIKKNAERIARKESHYFNAPGDRGSIRRSRKRLKKYSKKGNRIYQRIMNKHGKEMANAFLNSPQLSYGKQFILRNRDYMMFGESVRAIDV